MIEDIALYLDVSQQTSIASWAIKTAMVLDSVEGHSRFYDKTERENLKANNEDIPCVAMQIRMGKVPQARELLRLGYELSRAGQLRLRWMQRGLPLFVLPPRSPKLNGQVERSHRTTLTSRSVISPRSSASSVRNLDKKKPSVTNHVDNYTSLTLEVPRA